MSTAAGNKPTKSCAHACLMGAGVQQAGVRRLGPVCVTPARIAVLPLIFLLLSASCLGV